MSSELTDYIMDEFDQEFLVEDPLLVEAAPVVVVPPLARPKTAEELADLVIAGGGKPTIIYYWAPWADQPSPTEGLLEDLAEIYQEEIDFILVEGAFALAPMTYEDLPSVVLYFRGVKREFCPINWRERGLIGSTDLYYLIEVALDFADGVRR